MSDQEENLQESEPDYYIENGLLVMTKSYHLKRGYCCGSACRNCPFEHINVETDGDKG